MNLLWQQDCKVPSAIKPCDDLSVTEVADMCTVMEKVPTPIPNGMRQSSPPPRTHPPPARAISLLLSLSLHLSIEARSNSSRENLPTQH